MSNCAETEMALPHTRDVLTPQVTPGATPCPHPDALEFLTPSVISSPEPALILAEWKVLALYAIGKEIFASLFSSSLPTQRKLQWNVHLFICIPQPSVESATVGRRRKHKQPRKKKKEKKTLLFFQREQAYCLTQCVAERLSYGELQGPMASVSFL